MGLTFEPTTAEKPEIPPGGQTAQIRTEIPGPRSRAWRAREERLIAPGIQSIATESGIVVDFGQGSTLTDLDGNRFLDVIGGIGVNALGHGHPEFARALAEQAARYSVGSYSSQARVELLERLERHAPAPGMNRLQLYSSGAEAVESALRLAKSYTGKSEFVSFWGGFHGKTQGVLGLMGSDFKRGMGPMPAGSHVVPYPDPYRPPVKTEGSLTDACLDLAAKQIKYNTVGGIAAFIVEPIQGTAGNVIPPDDFLPKLKELARELDALLIVDEMITGFGRTGRYWGSQHSGVEPDIVTIGKQFGGGYPVSGVLSRSDVVGAAPWSNPSGSSSSWGGNALACAAASTSLRIIDEEGLVKNASAVGAHFLARLEPFMERYPFVGDVRGRGLLLGVELVADKQTRRPLPKPVCKRLFHEALRRGLLTTSYAPSFRIQPALGIDADTVDNAVDILQDSLDAMAREGWWRG
jgi:4-aminobutyrate aminotransferase-like enzyme